MIILPVAEQSEHRQFPAVTVGLIVLNILAYIAESTLNDDVVRSLCFIPAHPTLLTMFTSMFLHGGFLHLLGNMWFLWIVGPNVEEALTPFGMLFLYLGAGCFADFAHAHMIPPDMMGIPTLGASGAIAGIMGASIILFPFTKVRFWYFIWLFIFFMRNGFFEVDAVWAIGLWLLQQFILNYTDAGGGVAYGAHLGGFGISAAVTLLLVLCRIVEPHWRRSETAPAARVVPGYRDWTPPAPHPTLEEARQRYEELQAAKLKKQKPELPPLRW